LFAVVLQGPANETPVLRSKAAQLAKRTDLFFMAELRRLRSLTTATTKEGFLNYPSAMAETLLSTCNCGLNRFHQSTGRSCGLELDAARYDEAGNASFEATEALTVAVTTD
jgi:hypothetical protein